MKHLLYVALLLTGSFYDVVAEDVQNSGLQCEVLLNGHKRIQCTYTADRYNYDRNITFMWHSQETPQDDRERTILIKENHASIYDYRYFFGRAQGIWEISVKDDDEELLASTTFEMK